MYISQWRLHYKYSPMMALLKMIIFLGYLNWFYTVGYSLFQIIRGRRDRTYIIRAVLTLFIPWVGGIIYWLFPFVVVGWRKVFQKRTIS